MGDRRGAGAVIMPARTVAIWTAEVAPIAATSWPPNAGFHAISRPSSTSRSTASPVRPASRRAATRDATSRPHAVEPVMIAHGAAVPAQLTTAVATSSSTFAAASCTISSAPHAASTAGSGSSSVMTRPRARRCRLRDARPRRAARGWSARGRARPERRSRARAHRAGAEEPSRCRSSVASRSAPRSRNTCTAARTCSVSGAVGVRDPGPARPPSPSPDRPTWAKRRRPTGRRRDPRPRRGG